jgi:hypothetical protein
MLSAQMSARFTAAAALLGKPVDNPVFFSEHYADTDIAALTGRIELEPAEDQSVSVSIGLRSGREIALHSEKSDVLFPADGVIRDRFLRRVGSVQGRNAAVIAELVADLPKLNDVGRLTTAMSMSMVPPRAASDQAAPPSWK